MSGVDGVLEAVVQNHVAGDHRSINAQNQFMRYKVGPVPETLLKMNPARKKNVQKTVCGVDGNLVAVVQIDDYSIVYRDNKTDVRFMPKVKKRRNVNKVGKIRDIICTLRTI